MYVMSVTDNQMIWIAAVGIGASVNHKLFAANSSIPMNPCCHSMCCGHDVLACVNTPSTHHAITLFVNASIPIDATCVRVRHLVSLVIRPVDF
jgi:hypothetical protein